MHMLYAVVLLDGLLKFLAISGALVAVAAFVAGRRDLARSDASRVYVIVTAFRYGEPSVDSPLFTNVRIVNDGPLPIFSVGLSTWDWGHRRTTWRLRRHRRWMTGRRLTGQLYPTVLPESQTDEATFDGVPGYPNESGQSPYVLLVFRDGLGREWVRWHDGRLSRLYPYRRLVRVVRDRYRPRTGRRLRQGSRQAKVPGVFTRHT